MFVAYAGSMSSHSSIPALLFSVVLIAGCGQAPKAPEKEKLETGPWHLAMDLDSTAAGKPLRSLGCSYSKPLAAFRLVAAACPPPVLIHLTSMVVQPQLPAGRIFVQPSDSRCQKPGCGRLRCRPAWIRQRFGGIRHSLPGVRERFFMLGNCESSIKPPTFDVLKGFPVIPQVRAI